MYSSGTSLLCCSGPCWLLVLMTALMLTTQLENWTPASDENDTVDSKTRRPSSSKHSIELAVPSGQTDLAVQLIKCMYEKVPELSDMSHEQLLQLLMLADRFGVPKVQAAVLDAFKAVSVDQLEWDTALALLNLPASCAELEGCKEVSKVAVKKLLQKLGDLEQVWADEQLQQLLLGLHHPALLHLLQHDETHVANEAIVVYTIQQWYRKQTDSSSTKLQQLQQLMQQVRMQHLSQLYISTVLMRSDEVLLCYTPAELAIACMCASADSLETVRQACLAELQNYPAWTAPLRPASSMQQEVSWKLPLTELQAAVEKHLCSGAVETLYSQSAVRQGYSLALRMNVSKPKAKDTNSDRTQGVMLGLFIIVRDLPTGGVCKITADLAIKANTVPRTLSPVNNFIAATRSVGVTEGPYTMAYTTAKSWGFSEVLNLSSADSWTGAEAVLRGKKLVHEDGCMHIQAVIRKIV